MVSDPGSLVAAPSGVVTSSVTAYVVRAASPATVTVAVRAPEAAATGTTGVRIVVAPFVMTKPTPPVLPYVSYPAARIVPVADVARASGVAALAGGVVVKVRSMSTWSAAVVATQR